jgi:hypothetical protein
MTGLSLGRRRFRIARLAGTATSRVVSRSTVDSSLGADIEAADLLPASDVNPVDASRA